MSGLPQAHISILRQAQDEMWGTCFGGESDIGSRQQQIPYGDDNKKSKGKSKNVDAKCAKFKGKAF